MKVRLLASEIIIKCGVFWSQPAAEIEVFHLHLITTTYRDAISGSGKSECWLVVLTMVRIICIELIKVRVKSENNFGEICHQVMVGQ